MFRPLLKKILHVIFGEYQYWMVFSVRESTMSNDGFFVRTISADELRASPDAEVRSRADYGDVEAIGYGLFISGDLACVQWYLWGARYERERQGRSRKIPQGSAKLVGLYTLPAYRGRGLATALIRQSSRMMLESGFTELYCRIWHSHTASIAAFRSAGWTRVGSYVEICPLGHRLELRLPRVGAR